MQFIDLAYHIKHQQNKGFWLLCSNMKEKTQAILILNCNYAVKMNTNQAQYQEKENLNLLAVFLGILISYI